MKILAATILTLVGFAILANEEVVVTKDARTQNPSLHITSWTGDQALREQLENNIADSNWFDLSNEKTADYRLAAEAARDGEHFILKITLSEAQSAVTFELRHTNPRWLIYRAVDALIETAFKNPGFCSTKIAFVQTQGQTKEVWLADFDGSAAEALTTNGTISTEPAWGGRNRYLAYTLYGATATDVILLDLQQQRHKRLASYGGLNSGAALANNSLTAAMTLSKGGKQVDLFVKEVASDRLIALTNDHHVEASPCWSPDDKQICYVGSMAGRPTLFLIASLGGIPERLSPLLMDAASPDWSPVSNKIAFSLRQGGEYTIAEIDMNKPEREMKILVRAAGDWEAPSWTADGRHLVCSRKLDGKQTLYLIDSWYGKIRQLKTPDAVGLPACSARY